MRFKFIIAVLVAVVTMFTQWPFTTSLAVVAKTASVGKMAAIPSATPVATAIPTLKSMVFEKVKTFALVGDIADSDGVFYRVDTPDNSICRTDGVKKSCKTFPRNIVRIAQASRNWIVLYTFQKVGRLEVWNWTSSTDPVFVGNVKEASGDTIKGNVAYFDQSNLLVYSRTSGGIDYVTVAFLDKGTKRNLRFGDDSAFLMGNVNNTLLINTQGINWRHLVTVEVPSFKVLAREKITAPYKLVTSNNTFMRWNDGPVLNAVGSPQFLENGNVVVYQSSKMELSFISNKIKDKLHFSNPDLKKFQLDHGFVYLLFSSGKLEIWSYR